MDGITMMMRLMVSALYVEHPLWVVMHSRVALILLFYVMSVVMRLVMGLVKRKDII
jgi:hypothetical protein